MAPQWDAERAPLLHANETRRRSELGTEEAAIPSHGEFEEQKMTETAIGERLAYNNYTTIDQLHDLASSHYHLLRSMESILILNY